MLCPQSETCLRQRRHGTGDQRFGSFFHDPARTAVAQAIHPGWNSASSASNATLTRSKMYSILSYRICTPTQKHGREALRPLYYCRGGEEGRFFRNRRGCAASRQGMKRGRRIKSVKAPDTSSMRSAYTLRWSSMTPIILKTRAKGGQSSMRDFTKIPSGLLHPGRRISSSGMATPKIAKIFAAVFP